MLDQYITALTIAKRVLVGLCLCVLTPYIVVVQIVEHLELSWWNIFMVSGLESLWVYLCWDISKWIKQAWDER